SAESGADGIVIWGGHDPSLRSARELVDVPVIGPGMASMLLACSLARRFSLLVQLPNVLAIAERQIRELGLGERCASIRSVDLPLLELAGDEVFPKMLDAALAAVDEDGADAICLGSMARTPQAPRRAGARAERRPGALGCAPGLAAVRWLEMPIGMGLSHSRGSYLTPLKPVTC